MQRKETTFKKLSFASKPRLGRIDFDMPRQPLQILFKTKNKKCKLLKDRKIQYVQKIGKKHLFIPHTAANSEWSPQGQRCRTSTSAQESEKKTNTFFVTTKNIFLKFWI